MKALHTASPAVLLDLESRALRRENAALYDQLAAVRRELAEVQRERDQARRDLDDALDQAQIWQFGEEAEQHLMTPRYPWSWAHSDTSPLTVTQAHAAMQQHRSCDIETCARRRTARDTLREAGHMRADSARPATW